MNPDIYMLQCQLCLTHTHLSFLLQLSSNTKQLVGERSLKLEIRFMKGLGNGFSKISREQGQQEQHQQIIDLHTLDFR